MSHRAAIHQPNFFPWLGYFDKIQRSDIFIFLDNVQFPKKGGTWTNRVKLWVSGEARWVTGVVDRKYEGVRSIVDMEYQKGNPWKEKLIKSIEQNYRKHTFYNEAMEVLEPLIANKELNVAEYNIHSVRGILRHLNIDSTSVVRSSELDHDGHSNELLCSLTKAVDAKVYMCGGGADGYQDEAVFAENGIKLEYQNFNHPEYLQLGISEFVAGLSVIDALMNIGLQGTSKLILSHPS